MIFNFEIESLFFYPDSLNHGGHPKKDGFRFKTLKIPSTDSITLDGWFVFSRSEVPKATIIYFHGNACNITNHWHQVDWIPALDFDLLIFDYRGYGKSDGKPTFKGVFDDCSAVIDFARTHSVIRNRLFIILGQSLGGAFSIKAVAEKLGEDILGIIIDSSFSSFQEIAVLKAPLIPGILARGFIEHRITDEFAPVNFIDRLKMPKLFIHSIKDPVVPYELGLQLYLRAPEPKTFLKLTNSNHLSLFSIRQGSEWKSVLSFLDTVCNKELKTVNSFEEKSIKLDDKVPSQIVSQPVKDRRLNGHDLSNAYLRDANFKGTDLSYTNLSSSNLSYGNFSDANLSNANLSNANLSNADLSNADLSHANLRNAIIHEQTKIDRKWRLVWEIVTYGAEGQNLINADLSNADLSGVNLSSSDLSCGNFSSTDLSNANLSRANLSRANLSRANLSNADLSNANLSNADLSNADLSHANLRNAIIHEQTKIDRKWRLVWEIVTYGAEGQNLINADLSNADLSGVNLSGANLSDADLSDTNLRDANLSCADLSDADLSGTNLRDANLRDAVIDEQRKEDN